MLKLIVLSHKPFAVNFPSADAPVKTLRTLAGLTHACGVFCDYEQLKRTGYHGRKPFFGGLELS